MANNQQESAVMSAAASAPPDDIPSAPVPAEDIWGEEQLEKAMKILKEMHIQLRGLRTTIPRLVAPLTTQQNPDTLFEKLAKSIKVANQEVQDFQQLMTNEESSNVLEHARNSRAANPKGIRPWRVSEHPDWLTRES